MEGSTFTQMNSAYLENQLLLISINFTPKTSHSCLKKWYTRFSRYCRSIPFSLPFCSANLDLDTHFPVNLQLQFGYMTQRRKPRLVSLTYYSGFPSQAASPSDSILPSSKLASQPSESFNLWAGRFVGFFS